jgi:nucleoside-diphosphate-sugar epimerase
MALFLVTGGAGFIGSHLVEELLGRGEQVRVLDNFSTGKRERLTPFANRIDIVEGDLRSQHTVRHATDGVDYILHQGALPSVPRSIEDPITTNDVNIGGTLNVLDAAREAGVKRVVFASSSSVYGSGEGMPKREDMLPQPISPYAVTKLTGEKYCQVFSETYGLETVALRYFNVFGPGMDPNSAYSAFIAIFIVGMLEGRALTVNGDGTIARDFTYITNVVHANMCAVEARDAAGGVFNIGCGDSLSLNGIIDRLRELIGVRGDISYGPAKKGDLPRSEADISAARDRLGYAPLVLAAEGLERAVSWYRDGR